MTLRLNKNETGNQHEAGEVKIKLTYEKLL